MDEKPILISGKSYISARQAAMLCSYTLDYVGQLARAGKIESVMLGRDRYIEFSSLNNYLEKPSTKLWTKDINISPSRANPALRQLATVFILALMASFIANPSFGSHIWTSVKNKLVTFDNIATKQLEHNSSQSQMSASFISTVVDSAKLIDTEYIGFLESVQNKILSFFSNVRKVILVLTDPLLNKKITTQKTVVIENNSSSTITNDQIADLNTTPESGGSFLDQEQVREIVKEVVSEEIAKTIDYTSYSSKSNIGIAVTPSSGSILGDEKIKEAIAKAFSDEVSVESDQSGMTGTIRPIFKNSTDDKYIFVIAPVNHE